jgi:hypothetical protein
VADDKPEARRVRGVLIGIYTGRAMAEGTSVEKAAETSQNSD